MNGLNDIVIRTDTLTKTYESFAFAQLRVLRDFVIAVAHIRSTARATPLPPPRQSVAMPRLRLRCLSV